MISILRNKLAVNFIFQIIVVIAIVSSGFYILTTMQSQEMEKRIFDKAELYSLILGVNLDKIIADNLLAFGELQEATAHTAVSNDLVERVRVITPNYIIISSSEGSDIWTPVEEAYHSIIDDVISRRQPKSITKSGMGEEIVVHFMPIIVTMEGQEPLIGLIQVNARFPSQQGRIISSVRANKKMYFRKEAHEIAQNLGEGLRRLYIEAERNFGYLKRLIDNMTGDRDIKGIQLFSQKLGGLIFGSGQDVGRFISRDRSALQMQAMDQQSIVVGDRAKKEDGLRVASPLYVQRGVDKEIAGAIELEFSLERVQALIAERRSNILMMNLAIACAFCLLIGLFFKRRIFGPLKELASLTDKISRGDFSSRAPITVEDEIGQLAGAFNGMIDELARSKNEIKQWNLTLQKKVDHVTRELELKQKQLLKSEKLASLGVLSSGIAHEINNPLGIILGQTQMLLRDLRDKDKAIHPKEIEGLLEGVEENTKRCSHIVKSLLQFAKTKTFQFQRVDVDASIERALSFTEARFAKKNIEVSREYPECIPVIQADPIQLDQVFINILINAEQSINSQGRVHIKVSLVERSAKSPTLVRIAFEDNGRGIARDHLGRIFDPFFSTKEPGDGVGLGLSVSYGIIKAHGGTIEIKSEEGKGAQVCVMLPIEDGV